MNDHCHIHVLELDKWQKKVELSVEDQWIYFFKEAKNWTELPTKLNTPELRQAMATLRRFSEQEKEYDLYQARQTAIHEENSRQGALEDALKKQSEAIEAKDEAMELHAEAVKKQKEESHAKEEALEEQARLRELLRKSGIDPDADSI